MITKKKRVLILEKTPELQEFWPKKLEAMSVDVDVHPAYSVRDFYTLFKKYRGTLDMVVIGNSLYDDGLVEEAIAYIRSQEFTGPIICCTVDGAALKRQFQAGGPNTCVACKRTLPEAIIGVLGLIPKSAPVAA